MGKYSVRSSWGGRIPAGFRLLAIAALTVSGSQTLHAQAVAGINGTITDPSGDVVPNVAVTILNNATGVVQTTTTSSAGVYAVNGLIPGRYTVTAVAPGFKKDVEENVLLEIGSHSNIPIKLSVGGTGDTVQVSASDIALNTTDVQLGTTVEPKLLNALPIELSGGRGRQIDSFQFLAPGVQGSSFTHNVSGGVTFQEEIVVNGIPLPQAETQGMTTNINPPWELIHEFRVERSTFSAQYGLGQGAINYQTADGTNEFHGDIFEINRNSSFDSKGFFRTVVPTDHENNYGFTLGGPVWIPKVYDGHNRTFFHYSQEWYKQNNQNTSFSTVPTAQEKNGDFSDFVNGQTGALIPIYDPTTGQQFNYGGKLNVIDPARISPTSKSLLQYLPDPDIRGTGVGGLDANKNYANFIIPTINHNWGFTIDHNLTPTQTLHWAEWRNTRSTDQFQGMPFVAPPNPLNTALIQREIGTGFLLSYSNSVTPHLVMTAGAGWIGEINNQDPSVDYNFSAVQNPLVLPEISFDGQHAPAQFGSVGSLAHSINRKLGLAADNNWLWTVGRNSFNIGGESRRTYQDAYQDGSGGGHISFSQRTTSTPNQGDNFSNNGSAFASFLLGEVDSANRSFSQSIKLRNFSISPYIMDDIKVTPKLTANLGVRWDILVPFTANANNVAFLDTYRRNSYAGGLPGVATQLGYCPNCSGFDRAGTHFGHFGPRVGLSYMLNNRTVVQAGFSLAYLIGGAYDYGDGLIADSYTFLLGGQFTRNSTNTNTPAFGSWDANQLPAPPPSPITPQSGVGGTINQLSEADGFAPYTQQWNFNVQRQLPYDLFLTVAYIGNREIHVISQLNPLNQLNPSYLQLGSKLGDNFADGSAQKDGFTLPYPNFVHDFGSSATVGQALQPYPQYGNIFNSFDGAGTAFYNGLQAQVEKRYTNGLAFLSSLTIARTMSNNDSGIGSFTARPLNKYNQKAEYTVAASDQVYNYKLSGTYELPIGINKPILNHGLAGRLLGGFQISAILDYEGGGPFGIGENGSAFPNGFNRPNRVAGQSLSTYSYGRVHDYFLGKRPNDIMFNTAAFQPTASQYVLGNAVRNYTELRNPPYRNENINAVKNFQIGERVKASIEAEFFNAFNRTIFGGPDNNVNSSTYGEVTGKPSTSQRQGQLTARIEF